MPKSSRLERGPKWLQKAINDVRDDALQAQPIKGVGIKTTAHPQGTVIDADASASQLPPGTKEIDLKVCIEGVEKTVTFIVKGDPH